MTLAQTNDLEPAVFLDRDGTIIEDRGHLGSPDQVIFLPGSVAALQRLQPHFKLCIVTNQSGVFKGELTMAQVEAVNTHIVDQLRQDGVVITAVYVCPHQRSESCPCIKPNRYFADLAAREHGLDLARSFAVGDHPHDAEFGRQLGGTGLYVLTGHGERHRAELRDGEIVQNDLAGAANWILNQITQPPPQSTP
jgi:histidinol-phosphate phosphatase family protein